MNKATFESLLNTIMGAIDYDDTLGIMALALLSAIARPCEVDPDSLHYLHDELHEVLHVPNDAVAAFAVVRTLANLGTAIRVGLEASPEVYRITREGDAFRLFGPFPAPAKRNITSNIAHA